MATTTTTTDNHLRLLLSRHNPPDEPLTHPGSCSLVQPYYHLLLSLPPHRCLFPLHFHLLLLVYSIHIHPCQRARKLPIDIETETGIAPTLPPGVLRRRHHQQNQQSLTPPHHTIPANSSMKRPQFVFTKRGLPRHGFDPLKPR